MELTLVSGVSIFFFADPDAAYLDRKETYFSPAFWVYCIWPAVHVLLLGYVIYQFFHDSRKVVVDGIGWRFPLLMVLSGAFFVAWCQKLYLPSFVLAFLLSGSVSHIFYVIKKKNGGKYHNMERELFREW